MRKALRIAVFSYCSAYGGTAPVWSAEGPFALTTVTPCRVVNTLSSTPLVAGLVRSFDVTGLCGVPVGATAIYANVAAVWPTTDGHIRVFSEGAPLPPTSVVNFPTGSFATSNGVLVSLSSQTGRISAYAGMASGNVHMLIDVLGYYSGPGSLRFFGLPACRLLDTRNPGMGPGLLHGERRDIQVQGLCGVEIGARAVTVTVTIVDPTDMGHLVAYPYGGTAPSASVINFPALTTGRANGSVLPLSTPAAGTGYDLSVEAGVGTSGVGTAHLLLDVTGYYKE
jgi:hypothetical protein